MIESVNNEKIKNYSKLNDKKYRKKEGLFIAPGSHLVEEAIKKGIVKEIFLLQGIDNTYNKDVTYVSYNVMKKLTSLDTPPKEVAICKIMDNDEIKGNVIILDDISDPGNLGTIIRSAVAFNYETIILSLNTVDIYNLKTIRATEGMLFNVNIIIDLLPEKIKYLKDNGYIIYGTDVKDGISPYKEEKKHALVIGSEARGISKDILDLCDYKFNIKMNPLCESLNAGVSASILMHALGGK